MSRYHFSIARGFNRIVIRDVMKKEMLCKIQFGHEGVNKSIDHARSSVWWHGMTKDIKDYVN